MGTHLRWLAVLAVSLTALLYASTAGATVATNANSAAAVSSSLMNGTNSLTATAGDTVSADVSVTNLLDASAYIRIYVIADWDHGWSPNINKLKKLKDGDTWDASGQFKVGTFTPPGTYMLRVIADTAGNPLLEADASILVL
jgi:poly(3-hydroxybutyrate) depolymerase